jgi:uncharacterized protein (DUF433 family)
MMAHFVPTILSDDGNGSHGRGPLSLEAGMTRADDELIERHIDPESLAWGAAEARLADSGVPVWAVIGAWRAAGEDAEQAAADYKLSPEAARAALAYYARHRKVIDAQLTLNADFFTPAR